MLWRLAVSSSTPHDVSALKQPVSRVCRRREIGRQVLSPFKNATRFIIATDAWTVARLVAPRYVTMGGEMTEWITVAASTEIAAGHGKAVNVVGASIAVFNVGGEFLAVENTCPHQGGPLGEGTLDGPVVTCPWHGWRYDVRTGCPVLTPAVKTFEVRTNGAELQL